MSQAVITNNQSLKVNRAISGATTVNANCYAIVDYHLGAISGGPTGSVAAGYSPIITKYFGPGQSVPSSYGLTIGRFDTTITAGTYNIVSGVELINNP